MPKLKSLLLGTLYEIKELHFGSFPSLESFRVSSQWHLPVTFPTLQRHRNYPKVKQLELPDSLTDHTFLEKVVKHFPNIEQCGIYLPSVKVLRALSKQLSSLPQLKLKEMDLKLQFDFASSLDYVFLDKPSTLTRRMSGNELRKIQLLKQYEHWKEYSIVYGIDIPNEEELSVLENEDEFRGLGELCKRLPTLDLKIQHIPRTLRIPKGKLKWDDEHCVYTDELIGFESMEYPFSSEAWQLGSLGMTVKEFKLPPSAYRFHISDPEAFVGVDTSISHGPGAKKERLDLDEAVTLE